MGQVDGSKILKWILEKQDRRMRTSSGQGLTDFCHKGDETSESTTGNLLYLEVSYSVTSIQCEVKLLVSFPLLIIM
jgi:hypothetical protein